MDVRGRFVCGRTTHTLHFTTNNSTSIIMPIQITTAPSREDLRCRSHWWGAPDLPAGVPYPYVTVGEGTDDVYDEPLTFVCQIRLADVANLDKDNLLPHEGMLYIFAPLDYFLGELDSPLNQHVSPVVIYSPQTTDLQPYVLCWEGTDETVFRPAEAMSFALDEAPTGDGLRMLGQPYQEDVHDLHPHDVCLLQIDEEDRWGLRFYDCGTYYLFLSPEALKEGRWEEVSAELFYY